MNIKYLPEILLITAGVFYYYVAALFPNSTQEVLMYTAIVGIVLSGLILIRHLIINSISRKVLAFMVAFFVIFISSYLLGWPNMTWIALMAVPLLSIDRDFYIKIIFLSSLILFLTTVGLSIWGPLPLEYVNFAGEIEERYGSTKYSLGFDGPNQAAFAFFAVLLSGLYTYGTNRAFVVVISLGTILVGLLTGSRTGFICSVLFIVFYLSAMKKRKKRQKRGVAERPNVLLPYLFVILAGVSVLVAVVYRDSLFMNELLSNRPEAIGYYLNSDYIPSLLGNNEVYNKAQFQTPPLDNYPMYMLGRYGVVGFSLIALLFYFSLRREVSTRIKIIFTFMLLYGMTEAFLDIPAKNFLLPIFLYALITNEKKRLS